MPAALLAALATLIAEAPQLIAGGEAVVNEIGTALGVLSKHGIVPVDAATLAKMNSNVAAAQAGQLAAQAAAGPKPTA